MCRPGIFELCLLVSLTIGACGGSADGETNARAKDPGQPNAAPSLRTLPADDVDPRRFTPLMKRAWELSGEAFALKTPQFPANPTTEEWNAWSARIFRPWLEKKQNMVVQARRELDGAATQGLRYRIMAGAIVGLLYEDLAHVLLAVPTPTQIAHDDPEIVEAFQRVVEGQARPYLEHSRAAYSACKQNAAGGRVGLAHWSNYCGQREGNLPRLHP